MKTIVNRSAFLESATRIAGIVAEEYLLKDVRLTAAGATLALHAAALDFEIVESVGHLTVGDGDASVQLGAFPGRYFGALNIDTFIDAFVPTVTVPARDLPSLLGHAVTVPAHYEDPFTREGRHLRIPTPRPDTPERAEIPGPPGFDGRMGVLVPSTTVAELTRLCDVDGNVAIEVNEDCIRLKVGSIMLTSRQVDAPSSYLA